MTPIFDHILVPLDFTDRNRAALDVALEVGKSRPFRLTLLHVIEPIESGEEAEIEEFHSMLEAKARDKMRDMATSLESRGATPAQEIVFGQRAAEIVRYAMSEGVTLIVLSSRKVELAPGAHDLATLSHQVSILCQCPVLLVK